MTVVCTKINLDWGGLIRCWRLCSVLFVCLSVSGIHMVSDHIADRRSEMAIVKADIHDHYDKFKEFLSYQKRLFFPHFSKTLGR